MRYTTSAVVDAIQYDGDNYGEIAAWCDKLTGEETDVFSPAGTQSLFVEVPMGQDSETWGQVEVPVGHWLIRGVTGYFFTADPVHFVNTYQPVEETP